MHQAMPPPRPARCQPTPTSPAPRVTTEQVAARAIQPTADKVEPAIGSEVIDPQATALVLGWINSL